MSDKEMRAKAREEHRCRVGWNSTIFRKSVGRTLTILIVCGARLYRVPDGTVGLLDDVVQVLLLANPLCVASLDVVEWTTSRITGALLRKTPQKACE